MSKKKTLYYIASVVSLFAPSVIGYLLSLVDPDLGIAFVLAGGGVFIGLSVALFLIFLGLAIVQQDHKAYVKSENANILSHKISPLFILVMGLMLLIVTYLYNMPNDIVDDNFIGGLKLVGYLIGGMLSVVGVLSYVHDSIPKKGWLAQSVNPVTLTAIGFGVVLIWYFDLVRFSYTTKTFVYLLGGFVTIIGLAGITRKISARSKR